MGNMKNLNLKSISIAALTLLALSTQAFAQTAKPLTAEDEQAIQALASRYFVVLAACDAEGFVDLFVPDTGYFASGFRGHMEGRERLLGLVKSERHCDVAPGTAPAPRAGDTNRPAVQLTATATGASGVTDLGTAQYQDDYLKTPQGWRIAARSVIINAERDAGIDAKELLAIHKAATPKLVDNYVTNDRGIKQLLNVGVSLRVADGVVAGRTFVEGGGYNEDVFEKVAVGQWKIKARTFVKAAEEAK
jgi:hypothetical protein